MAESNGHLCPECRAPRGADNTPSCGCTQRASDALRDARTAEAAAAEDFDPLRIRPYVELDDETAQAIEDQSDDPEVAMQKKDTSDVLRKCLTKLSAEHREIIDLVYYHEKSVEEVSKIVGVPENTVKTRMFYARKRLGELLKAAGVERGWP